MSTGLPIGRYRIGRPAFFAPAFWRDRGAGLRDALAAASSGLLLALAFPDFDWAILAWIALVPFFMVITGKGVGGAAVLSFLMGLSFFVVVFWWVLSVRGLAWYDYLACGLYLSSFIALFGAALQFLARENRLPIVVTAPALWVSLEYLRSHVGLIVLPWALVGHSQYRNLPVIQIAAFAGVYGISFLIIMVNAAAAELLLYFRSKTQGAVTRVALCGQVPVRGTITACVLVALALGYGHARLAQNPGGPTLGIAVVQGNLPQEIRGRGDFRFVNARTHIQLTEQALTTSRPALIIWPEVAAQGSLRSDQYLYRAITDLGRRTDAYFLIGSAERPKYAQMPNRGNKSFNSAFLFSPEGKVVAQYNKIHLLPFSEYLPYEEVIPWPARYRASTAYFTPGREYTIFQLDDLRFGTTICWEAIFPDMFRRFVGQGVDFMVNITNEALFGATAAPHQFLSMIIFRAVENHVAIARSAYTGVSGFIDPHGRITGTVNRGGKETFVEGHLTAAIPLSKQRTFYTAYGDLFAYLCLATVALVLLRRVALTRRALIGNRAPHSL